MAINLSVERAISTAEAAVVWGKSRGGRPTHPTRITKAIKDGTPTPGGDRIYLEGLRLGGQWVTTVEAIQRYAEALTTASTGRPTAPAPISTTRARTLARIDCELDAAGIGGK
jgi:hypothetical protein